jgi:PAS domain-containing protein
MTRPGTEIYAPIRVLLPSLDVTDRKKAEDALPESEQRYRALLAGVPDRISRVRSDGTLVDFSPGHEALPYVPPSEFLGKTILEAAFVVPA